MEGNMENVSITGVQHAVDGFSNWPVWREGVDGLSEKAPAILVASNSAESRDSMVSSLGISHAERLCF